MVFIRTLMLTSVTLLFVACGGAQKKDEVEQAPETDVSEEGAPLVLIPNPYLSNPPSVPGQAKKEFEKVTVAMNGQQWKQAEGLLVLMTETYLKLSGPHVNLGICHYQQNEFEKAEASFKRAIEINNTNMDAYNWLAVIYREQGKFTDAEATYQAALAMWPHYPDAHRNLGILFDLYMGRQEEALSHYKILQRILPEEDRQLKGWIRDLERQLPKKESE